MEHPVEIFDVTIRDGSYVIDFQFTEEDNRAMCAALDDLGLKYIEVGHGLGLNAPNVKSPSAATDEGYLESASQTIKGARFGAFFIPGIGTRDHMKWARECFGMHFIRVGGEPERLDDLLPFIEYARDLGYEVMGNFMKTYTARPEDIARKAARMRDHGCDAAYVVDSAGGMLPDEVGRYCAAIRAESDIRVGFHGHNNLCLAAANSIAAIQNGATLIDCSIGGLGRSAGNTQTEMMIPILKRLGIPVELDLLSVLDVHARIVAPILRTRQATAQQLIGGYARVHSGLMQPFRENAARYNVPIDELLLAYGHELNELSEGPAVEELAQRLSGATRTVSVHEADEPILRIARKHGQGHWIHNTFVAFDELLKSARVLALKANLPTVFVVAVEPGMLASDADSVMAEYLYHDERFVVLRGVFHSVEQFARFKSERSDTFDLLLFEDLAAHERDDLAVRRSRWYRGERVVHLDLRGARYRSLMAKVRGVLADGNGSVLVVGGNPTAFAAGVPEDLRQADFLVPHSETDGSRTVLALDLATGRVVPCESPSPAAAAVLLSDVTDLDAELVAACLAPSAVLLDCTGGGERLTERLSSAKYTRVDLNRVISGELTSLLPEGVAA